METKKSDGEWQRCLGALAADAPRQLDILGHDGDALGVDGAQVGVLEQPDEVRLAGWGAQCRSDNMKICCIYLKHFEDK